jgi:quinol monooxygenase YgiN
VGVFAAWLPSRIGTAEAERDFLEASGDGAEGPLVSGRPALPHSALAVCHRRTAYGFLRGTTMATIEVRARLRIRDGKLDGFKRQAAEVMRQAKEKDSGTVTYDWFLSQDGTECELREAYVDADAFIEHAFIVREARDALFAEFAEGHKMAVYGDVPPKVIELMNKFGVDYTWFTPLQELEPATT